MEVDLILPSMARRDAYCARSKSRIVPRHAEEKRGDPHSILDRTRLRYAVKSKDGVTSQLTLDKTRMIFTDLIALSDNMRI